MESELVQRFSDSSGAICAMQISIRTALCQAAGCATGRAALHEISTRDPEVFFEAAIRVLESMAGLPEPPEAYARLVACPEFLIQLTRPDRFSRAKLLELCRTYIKAAKRLDINLADLLPRRQEDKYQLPPATVAHILDILNDLSVGPRLVLILGHLTDHPDPMVAERAVVLMGRRICNATWPQRHLAAEDEGVRAGAVESMWGRDTPVARTAMWQCVKDSSDRVVGNALLGLHYLGENSVARLATDMLDDSRPAFRSTAAKVMGRIGNAEYTEPLTRATKDAEPAVRNEAIRALVSIRRPILRQQDTVTKAPTPEPVVLAGPLDESPVDTPVETPHVPVYQVWLDGKHTSAR
jgi:hypothetical protein